MGVFKKGDDWYIDYYVSGRRKREKIGPNKKLAKAVLGKRKVEIVEDKFLDISRQPKVRFEDFAVEYLKFSETNKKSYQRDQASIKRLMIAFGGRCLSEITPLAIEHYKARRKDEARPATVNRKLACLKHMFTKAIEWGKATENPAKKVKLLRENNQRLRYLTPMQAKDLVGVAALHLEPIVITALNTGMRKGEILKLKWEDVDLRQGIIFVKDTKNSQWREIPINETLENLPRCSPYVFCNKAGKPVRSIRTAFEVVLRRAGIKDFHFHNLRHTFASNLVMAGVDLATVMELLGHKSIEMSMRYSHLSSLHKRQTVERLRDQMDTSPKLLEEILA